MSDDEKQAERNRLLEKIYNHILIIGNQALANDNREAVVYIDAACERIRFLCERYCDMDEGGV